MRIGTGPQPACLRELALLIFLSVPAASLAVNHVQVEMRTVQRGSKSSAKTPRQAAAKAARRDARAAAVAKVNILWDRAFTAQP